MGKESGKIRKECEGLTVIEILQLADDLPIGINYDITYSLYMIEYRKAKRIEYIEEKVDSIKSNFEVSRIQNGYHIITNNLGLLTYYPKGDRLQIQKQNMWLKTSGIDFIINNLS